jgi:hypothetical protein
MALRRATVAPATASAKLALEVDSAALIAEEYRQVTINERWKQWRNSAYRYVASSSILLGLFLCSFISVSEIVPLKTTPNLLDWNRVEPPSWYSQRLADEVLGLPSTGNSSERTYQLKWDSNKAPRDIYDVEFGLPGEYESVGRIYFGFEKPSDCCFERAHFSAGEPVTITLPSGQGVSYFTLILPISDAAREKFDQSDQFVNRIRLRVSLFTRLWHLALNHIRIGL